MPQPSSYFSSTRHPWPCLLFVLPLILAYELGVTYLGGAQSDLIRNGTDYWLREALKDLGPIHRFLAPVSLIFGLAVWANQRRDDRPDDVTGALIGTCLESIAFALGLWMLSRSFGPLTDTFGLGLSLSPETREGLALLLTYLGAGIYEETFFRLLIYSGLLWFFVKTDVPMGVSILLAALASATLFSLAHHVGPYGEPFEPYVFLFRATAGLYFALIYHFRGFGIAVGAHACYDVAVGVITQA